MDKKIVVKVPAGKLLKLFISIENKTITKIQITGDFFVYPEEAIQGLEERLLHHSLERSALLRTINHYMTSHNVTFFGITEEALIGAILQAGDA